MKVLVTGATGMLGRAVFAAASRRKGVEAVSLPRSALNILSPEAVAAEVAGARAGAVINCAGITKPLVTAETFDRALAVNAYAVTNLARACTGSGVRLVHVSTDCVFSGRRRAFPHREQDDPDPTDFYGVSKLLGEYGPQREAPHVVVRTSFVGVGSYGLVTDLQARARYAAMAAQPAPASFREFEGWVNAMWSGTTAPALAEVLVTLAAEKQAVTGILHVGTARPVSKAEVVRELIDYLGLELTVREMQAPMINRGLDCSRAFGLGLGLAPFASALRTEGLEPRQWPE